MNKKTRVLRIAMGGIALFIVLGLIIGAGLSANLGTFKNSEPMEDKRSFSQYGIDYIMTQVNVQEAMDKTLAEEFSSSAYDIAQPLVVMDPYGVSPLTGILVFNTKKPARITIDIPGKDMRTSVSFTFEDFEKKHMVPVYGLYANKTNKVKLTAHYKDGQKETVIVPMQTQPLPKVFESINKKVDLRQPSKYQQGFTFTYSTTAVGGKVAYDANGDVRWYLIGDFGEASNYNIDGDHIFDLGEYTIDDAFFIQVNNLGKVIKAMHTPYRIHHEIEQIDEETLLFGGDSINSAMVDDMIVELNMQTGEISEVLDLQNVLQTTRSLPSIAEIDKFHLNAIVKIKNTNDLLISSREQNNVVRLSWPEGDIKWMAGMSKNASPFFAQYYLTPIGDNFEYFYMQHAPLILPDVDENQDTMDILLFDNGQSRDLNDDAFMREVFENQHNPPGLYSRLVHYRIDEKNLTIEQIHQFGKEYGESLYSSIRGDVDYLPNGNWLGTFEVDVQSSKISKSPTYIEIDKEGNIVWMLQTYIYDSDIPLEEYRSERMTIYGNRKNVLNINETCINLIPQDVLSKYGY